MQKEHDDSGLSNFGFRASSHQEQQAAAPPTTTVAAPIIVGPKPVKTVCPQCQANILSNVETGANMKTHFMALILCCVGCCLCSCIPYCKDSCQSQRHYCPRCNAFLGTYSD